MCRIQSFKISKILNILIIWSKLDKCDIVTLLGVKHRVTSDYTSIDFQSTETYLWIFIHWFSNLCGDSAGEDFDVSLVNCWRFFQPLHQIPASLSFTVVTVVRCGSSHFCVYDVDYMLVIWLWTVYCQVTSLRTLG